MESQAGWTVQRQEARRAQCSPRHVSLQRGRPAESPAVLKNGLSALNHATVNWGFFLLFHPSSEEDSSQCLPEAFQSLKGLYPTTMLDNMVSVLPLNESLDYGWGPLHNQQPVIDSQAL